MAIFIPLIWLVLLPFAIISVRRWRQGGSLGHRLWRLGVISAEILLTLLVIAGVFHIGCAVAKARQAQCSSNMRTLWFAVSLYMQDWDERLPSAIGWGDAIAKGYLAKVIADRDEPKSPEQAFRCPSARSPFGYAFNTALDKFPIAKLKAPAETVLLFESDATSRNAAGDQSALPPEPRHPGGDIYGSVDGRVKLNLLRDNKIALSLP